MFIKNPLNLILLVVSTATLFNCSRDEKISGDIMINDFIWGGLNAFYKYQPEVNALSDRKFNSRDELNTYLKSFSDSKEFFDALLAKEKDSISSIYEDYNQLHETLDGYTTTNGMYYSLSPYQNNSDSIYAYVRYVIKNSDAYNKGITRGTIFNQINNQHLTTKNYKNLVENKEQFTITLANYNDGNPIPTSKVPLLREKIGVNPVLASSILEENETKIGYLCLNRLTPKQDNSINTIIADFKSNSINSLIIDLRYCNSGSIESSSYLASMITGQFSNELFANAIWNNKVMTNVNPSLRNTYFKDKINNTFTEKTTINSLNLTTVYFLTSEVTAGAAEVLINGLKSYIDVKLIGSKTAGQFLCSSILYDSDDYSTNGNNFNTSHNWCAFPVVAEIQNKANQNSNQGITPDFFILETPSKLGKLGTRSDVVLQQTIDFIANAKTPDETNSSPAQILWNSEENNNDFEWLFVNYHSLKK